MTKNHNRLTVQAWKHDLVAGFLVFLIALPLCLGISLASGFPAVAGILTAIVGGILTPFFSNSELTIKGPAAGLIVIVLGCITDFGFTLGQNPSADLEAYRLALGVGIAAAVLQILFGFLRSGVLVEVFPIASVHGMLTAIGIIIIARQLPVTLGVRAQGSPLDLLLHVPTHIRNLNPEIALIGSLSLFILFGFPLIRNRYVQLLPAPLLVLLIAVPLGNSFDLAHEHTYSLMGNSYSLGGKYLVSVPYNLFRAITFPDFHGLATLKAWKWVALYALIGSLESLLSAKAIDLLDPWKRKTNLDRDLVAVGIGNLFSAFLGGLPMISEIVRSRANIDNGARTRLSNMAHGLILLLAVVLFARVMHHIPLAALAAMLVYTGFRLAHPREFVRVFRVGPDQFFIYLGTIVAVLMTDLLIGVFVGVGLTILFHLCHGLPFRKLFQSSIRLEPKEEKHCYIIPQTAAVFSHWISLKKFIERHGIAQRCNVVIDLSEADLIDHTVMENLHQMERDFKRQELDLRVTGLERHVGLSDHPLATRRKRRTELKESESH